MPVKILVVEDEPDLKFLIEQKFRKRIRAEELQFLFVKNGVEALKLLEAHPDVYVVLSDIKMPEMDGLSLLKELNERYPLLRTIVISAYSGMQYIRTAMNWGAHDFLPKPVDFDDLEVTIDRTIQYVRRVMDEIAERKKAEKQVLQLEKAVENMQLGVTITDLDGKIIYTNPADAKMHGWQVEELIGKDVGVLAPPVLRHPITLEQIKKWKGLVRESVNIRKDGSSFPVWLMSEIVKDTNGEPTAIVTSCEDISERKQAEEEIKKHREHLEELIKERTAELIRANVLLHEEILERKRAEIELRTTNQDLQALNDRLQDELTLAKKIQQGLLPLPYPDWPILDVVCYSNPASEVGGDFYAYHAFNNFRNRYAITVGDVSGKGMPAALLMAISLASFQSVIGQGLIPKELLAHLDRAIMPYTKTTRQNCALVYVDITIPASDQRGILRVVNAGCITPIIRRIDGTIEWVDAGGMPLGIGLGAQSGYQEVTMDVTRGDVIVLISDGVVEAKNSTNEMFGFERLEEAVKSGPQADAATMLGHLQSEVLAFMENAELHDDLTIVVAQL